MGIVRDGVQGLGFELGLRVIWRFMALGELHISVNPTLDPKP